VGGIPPAPLSITTSCQELAISSWVCYLHILSRAQDARGRTPGLHP